MTSKGSQTKKPTLSDTVDKIFNKYTLIPSSETEDEGVQPSSCVNTEGAVETRRRAASSASIRSNANKDTEIISITIEPYKTQLSSTSNTDVATYARKTIPSALVVPTRPPASEDSVDELQSETESAAFAALNIPACERCYQHKITCKKTIPPGRVCVACRRKKKKCSLVSERSPKPGARGTSTDSGTDNNTGRSSSVSFEDDTGDESFEIDSEKVTSQRVLTHLLRLNKKQEERFERLEKYLKRLNKEIEGVREELGRVSIA